MSAAPDIFTIGKQRFNYNIIKKITRIELSHPLPSMLPWRSKLHCSLWLMLYPLPLDSVRGRWLFREWMSIGGQQFRLGYVSYSHLTYFVIIIWCRVTCLFSCTFVVVFIERFRWVSWHTRYPDVRCIGFPVPFFPFGNDHHHKLINLANTHHIFFESFTKSPIELQKPRHSLEAIVNRWRRILMWYNMEGGIN